MRMLIIALGAVAGWTFFAVSSVNAETTISFTGHVDKVPEPLMSQFQPDMPITGSYTFDESLSDADFLTTVTDFQMEIGDYSVGQDPASVLGDIALTPNSYTVVSIAKGETIADEFSPLLMALQLSATSSVVDTTSPIPPPLEVFDDPLWTLDFNSTGLPMRVEGTVETLVVPEPSSGLLFASAVIVLGRIAQRRRRLVRGHSRNPNRR